MGSDWVMRSFFRGGPWGRTTSYGFLHWADNRFSVVSEYIEMMRRLIPFDIFD